MKWRCGKATKHLRFGGKGLNRWSEYDYNFGVWVPHVIFRWLEARLQKKNKKKRANQWNHLVQHRNKKPTLESCRAGSTIIYIFFCIKLSGIRKTQESSYVLVIVFRDTKGTKSIDADRVLSKSSSPLLDHVIWHISGQVRCIRKIIWSHLQLWKTPLK